MKLSEGREREAYTLDTVNHIHDSELSPQLVESARDAVLVTFNPHQEVFFLEAFFRGDLKSFRNHPQCKNAMRDPDFYTFSESHASALKNLPASFADTLKSAQSFLNYQQQQKICYLADADGQFLAFFSFIDEKKKMTCGLHSCFGVAGMGLDCNGKGVSFLAHISDIVVYAQPALFQQLLKVYFDSLNQQTDGQFQVAITGGYSGADPMGPSRLEFVDFLQKAADMPEEKISLNMGSEFLMPGSSGQSTFIETPAQKLHYWPNAGAALNGSLLPLSQMKSMNAF